MGLSQPMVFQDGLQSHLHEQGSPVTETSDIYEKTQVFDLQCFSMASLYWVGQ
jgi:hypothetical protein